jgi:hypothetical protein
MFLILACVTFTGIMLIASHLEAQTLRRLVGYKLQVDIVLHGCIIVLFHSTFAGLMQAEFAGIMISISLRLYRHFMGYETLERIGAKLVWKRHEGTLTNSTSWLARTLR